MMRLKRWIAAFLMIAAISAVGCPAFAEESGSTVTDVTFLAGSLLLEEITSFGFGSHTIVATGQTYPALEGNVYLNVQDLRGSGSGWKILATGGIFNAPANTLPGAVIHFAGGEAIPTMPGNPPPNVEQAIALDMDGSGTSVIATAQPGTGLGNWSIAWQGAENENTSVLLAVPGGVGTVGTHTATIMWTLANAP